MSVEFKRDTGGQSGWTLTLDEGRLTLSGGSFADAYSPVEITVDQWNAFVADVRRLIESEAVA